MSESAEQKAATLSVPDGYVLVPKEYLEWLLNRSSSLSERERFDLPHGIPFFGGTMPICGCKFGTACGNVACPHRHQVTC